MGIHSVPPLAGAVFVALFVAAHFGVACIAFVTALCIQYMAYNILAFRRPVALLLLVCIIHA